MLMLEVGGGGLDPPPPLPHADSVSAAMLATSMGAMEDGVRRMNCLIDCIKPKA